MFKNDARKIITSIAPFGVDALLALPAEVFESAGWALCGSKVVSITAIYPDNVVYNCDAEVVA